MPVFSLVVDDGPAHFGRHVTKRPTKRDVEGCQVPGRTRLLGCWREEAIDRAHMMAGRLLDGVILHLHLVPAAQVNAAVGVGGAV